MTLLSWIRNICFGPTYNRADYAHFFFLPHWPPTLMLKPFNNNVCFLSVDLTREREDKGEKTERLIQKESVQDNHIAVFTVLFVIDKIC